MRGLLTPPTCAPGTAHETSPMKNRSRSLKTLLKSEGRLSEHIIDASRSVPSTATYQHRSGGIRNALIGYKEFRNMRGALTMRSRHNKVKETLLRRILATFVGQVRLIREQCGCWRVLELSYGLKVSVVISQCMKTTSRGFA